VQGGIRGGQGGMRSPLLLAVIVFSRGTPIPRKNYERTKAVSHMLYPEAINLEI
jgi:hypothetical protein